MDAKLLDSALVSLLFRMLSEALGLCDWLHWPHGPRVGVRGRWVVIWQGRLKPCYREKCVKADGSETVSNALSFAPSSSDTWWSALPHRHCPVGQLVREHELPSAE